MIKYHIEDECGKFVGCCQEYADVLLMANTYAVANNCKVYVYKLCAICDGVQTIRKN